MIITDPLVQQFILWALGILGAALLSVLVWLALGVLANQRQSDLAAASQFREFGKQLANVKELVTEDLHRHDVRLVRLEEWRKALDANMEHAQKENERLREMIKNAEGCI